MSKMGCDIKEVGIRLEKRSNEMYECREERVNNKSGKVRV